MGPAPFLADLETGQKNTNTKDDEYCTTPATSILISSTKSALTREDLIAGGDSDSLASYIPARTEAHVLLSTMGPIKIGAESLLRRRRLACLSSPTEEPEEEPPVLAGSGTGV